VPGGTGTPGDDEAGIGPDGDVSRRCPRPPARRARGREPSRARSRPEMQPGRLLRSVTATTPGRASPGHRPDGGAT
jgi:hypothetical protein